MRNSRSQNRLIRDSHYQIQICVQVITWSQCQSWSKIVFPARNRDVICYACYRSRDLTSQTISIVYHPLFGSHPQMCSLNQTFPKEADLCWQQMMSQGYQDATRVDRLLHAKNFIRSSKMHTNPFRRRFLPFFLYSPPGTPHALVPFSHRPSSLYPINCMPPIIVSHLISSLHRPNHFSR